MAKLPFLTVAPTSRQDIGGADGGSPITDRRAFVNALPQGNKHSVISLAQGLRFATPAYDSGDSLVLDSPITSPATGVTAGLANLWSSGPRIGFAAGAPAYNDMNGASSLVIDVDLSITMA